MAVTFTKTTWNNGAAPGISADQLNRIEQGIADAVVQANTASTLASAAMPLAGGTFSGSPVLTGGQPVELAGDTANNQLGWGLFGQTDAGIAAKGYNLAIGASGDVYIKANNHFDGTDRFTLASEGQASQLELPAGGGFPRIRYSTNTPADGGAITWGMWLTLTPVVVSPSDPGTLPEGGVWIEA